MTANTKALPTYFISHGGGPWPWVPKMRETFAKLETSLKDMVATWDAPPKAILMVSGHWEGAQVEVMATQQPPMIYDYHNFPKETYEVVYPAKGAPDFAQRTLELLLNAGFDAKLNTQQGYDHGVFVPMSVMYPNADIPLFQVSILSSYDPAEHFALGRALSALREEGVMIIGSGLSYHNLGRLGPEAAAPSVEFDAWLNAVMQMPSHERTTQLMAWEDAPSARICHPEEDHLVPLFVALGAAEDALAETVYHEPDMMGNIAASGFRFGAV
ncbi:DODA-type extradiol aromatic ring-opening family dioxygenase [Yoonia sp.]|uniref:DODA-type extradiol aromatic ring-opening family dioxygenase n=1 Tax=Yoonia sp. TaxID=2212373 RepID=UPI0023B5F55E